MHAKIERKLGREIRSLRYSQALTLEDIATRSGLSIGYLSQIERDLKRPSSIALERVSDALGTNTDWFLHSQVAADPFEARHVVRREHRRRMQFSRYAEVRNLIDRNFLLSPSLENDIVMAMMVLEPGEGNEVEASQHAGQEVGYVLSGVLSLDIDGKRLELEEGDSWFLKGSSPHRYVNDGSETVRLILANTPIVMVLR